MFNGSQVGANTTSDAKQINHLPSYLLKIRGGCEVDSKGKKAGKGPLIQKDVSATLGVSQDQYLFTPINSSGGGHSRYIRC